MAKYILLACYISALIYTGVVNRKHARTSGGFFLGGRGVGPVLSAFAYVTTYISAVAVINAGKIGWTYGIGSLFNGMGNILLGVLVSWLILGKKTRAMTINLDAMTMPEFLRARYESNLFKLLGAVCIFVFMVPYSGSVFMGLSYVFENIFHIPYYFALTSMTVLTGIYLTLGGYKAVALADAIQGLIMIIGATILAFFLWTSAEVGGPIEGIRRLSQINPALTSFSMAGLSAWTGLIPIIALTSIGPLGMPQMVQKFFAIKDNRSIIIATFICTFSAIMIIIPIHWVGFADHLFFDALPIDAQTQLPSADLLVPQMLERFLPEIALALIFLLIISASMSTLAGIVMVSASSIAMDLLKGYLKPGLSDKTVTLIMRVLCVLFILFSIWIALIKPTSIMSLQSVSWAAISGFFLAPYIYGVLWKGVTPIGALAGGTTGFLLGVILPAGFGVNPTNACFWAFLVPFLVTPVVSWMTPGLSPDLLRRAFK
jgi:SSS family solute:Na+ symporter